MPAAFKFADEHLVILADGSISQTRAAEMIGCSAMPVRRWRAANGIQPVAPTPASPLSTQVDEGPTREEMLQDEIRQLRAARNRNLKDEVREERAIQAIEAAAERVNAARPSHWPAPEADAAYQRAIDAEHSDAHHCQLGVWSDFHYGEVVDREQMSGLAEYDTDIAEARIDQLVRSTLAFKKVRPEMTKLHLALLGDMASGNIHGLDESNEVPAAEQYVEVGLLMGQAVAKLAPHYPKIIVDCTFGNHPRSKEAPVSKNGHDSGDWIAYRMAAATTQHLDNVKWNIPRAGMIVREIAGKTFLFWHGDGVRSSMPGVPWGGVMRRVNVLKSTYAAQGVYIDYVVLGHFHQACVVPGIFMNGALIGQNEYGLKNFGGGEEAKQLLLTFDEKRSRLTDVAYISFENV